jgi:TonB family protein
MNLMTKFALSLLLSGLSVPLFAADQKDIERALRQAYVGHVLSLKAPSNSDRLHFNPDGQVIGKLNPAPWTTFGLFRVMKLSLKKERLELEGERLIIAWRIEQTPSLMPVEIGKQVKATLESAIPISDVSEVNEMLSRVFEKGNIDKRIAEYWKPDPTADAAYGKPGNKYEVFGVLEGNRLVRECKKGVVEPPHALYDPNPTYTEAGKKDKIQGTTTIRLVVNERGIPEIIEISKGLADGLDLQSLDAISQWRFRPATMNGQPVPVVVDVEVTFRLY